MAEQGYSEARGVITMEANTKHSGYTLTLPASGGASSQPSVIIAAAAIGIICIAGVYFLLYKKS
jgi:hypothetical protein